MLTALKWFAAYLGLSVFLTLLAVLFGERPATISQWLWLGVLAIPTLLAGELIGHMAWNTRATRLIEEKTANTKVSLLRMAYAFVMLLLIGGVLVGCAYVWRSLTS